MEGSSDWPSSPQTEALQRNLEAGTPGAIDDFWVMVDVEKTPLNSPLEDDPEYALLTFVWRSADATLEPKLVSNLGGRDQNTRMTHLAGTDVWHITFKVHNKTRDSYQFKVDRNNVVDPYNPRQHVFPGHQEIGFSGWTSSVIELPEAPAQPWTNKRANVAKGKLQEHKIESSILDRAYPIWVYTPPRYLPDSRGYGFFLAFDGWFYVNLIPTPIILDNLLADQRIPPLTAIMVGAPFDRNRARDLACFPPFEEFIVNELLPWARDNYVLSRDPNQAAVVGTSRGGIMAVLMGLKHSNIFGHVISQSGAVGWFPAGEREDDWLARQFVDSPRLPLDFYLEAGKYEQEIGIAGRPVVRNLLVDNRHLRNVLRAKGYTVHYSEFYGGHNPMNWKGTIADGIRALFGASK